MCRRSASEENPGPQQPGLRGVTRASAHGHSCVSCLLFGHKQWHWARPGTHSPQQLGGKGPGVSKGSQGQLTLRVDSCPGALGRQGQIKVRRLQPDVQPRSYCSLGVDCNVPAAGQGRGLRAPLSPCQGQRRGVPRESKELTDTLSCNRQAECILEGHAGEQGAGKHLEFGQNLYRHLGSETPFLSTTALVPELAWQTAV